MVSSTAEATPAAVTVPRTRLVIRARRYLVAGLVALVPLAVAVYIVILGFTAVDNLLQFAVAWLLGRPVMGLGFIAVVLLVFAVGALLNNRISARVYRVGDKGLSKIPLFSPIYLGLKQMMATVSGESRLSFRQAILIEYPRPGLRAIAFITNELVNDAGQKLYCVFVPGTPNALTGWVFIVDEKQIIRTDLDVDCALRLVLSGGMVMPEKCRMFCTDEPGLFTCKPD